MGIIALPKVIEVWVRLLGHWLFLVMVRTIWFGRLKGGWWVSRKWVIELMR